MQFAIYDGRLQHNEKPFLFMDERTGKTEQAIYDSNDQANIICGKMNQNTTLTKYVVREYTL